MRPRKIVGISCLFRMLLTSGRPIWLIKGKGKAKTRMGSLNPFQLKAFYNVINVFMNSTLKPQGLHLTLIEARTSGTLVIASRFSNIKGTIVIDDEFGDFPNLNGIWTSEG
ncbi:hypothetical protein SLE2022_044100 [Rubroshorea leprosula]